MSMANAPQELIDLRDALLACSSVQAILTGLTTPQQQAHFYYPRADFRTDVMPGFVLSSPRYRVTRGTVGGYQGTGSAMAHLYIADASIDDGTIESYARAIARDLTSLIAADTMFIISAEAGECVEPDAAMQGAAASGQPDEASCSYRVVSISVEWEG